MRTRSWTSLIVPTLVLLAVIAAKIALAMNRYVDADEFAHIHWAYLIATGRIPFRDFFFHFFPVFHWMSIPLFFLLPQGPETILAARMGTVVAMTVTALLVYRMAFGVSRSAVWGCVAAVFYLAVPVTLDKSIEYRPDTLMTALAVGAAVLLMPRRHAPELLIMSGLCAATSMLVSLKSVAVLPAIVFLAVEPDFRRTVRNGILMALGAAIPLLSTAFYFVAHDLVTIGYQSIFQASSVLKSGEGAFSPFLTLSPLPQLYHMSAPVSWPWIFGTALWIAGCLGAVATVMWNRRIGFFLILWIGGCFLFLIGFPTPFTQYFILPSAVAAVAAVVAISELISAVPRHRMAATGLAAALLSVAAGVSVYQQVTERMPLTHDEQFGVIRTVLSATRPDETFYDMTGSYVFRPDGYYICCNIYSQFAFALPFPVPPLPASLVKNNTKFLVMDRRGAAFWHPYPDDKRFLAMTYVESRYPKIYVPGVRYGCSQGSCIQHLLSGEPVTVAPTGTVTITFGGRYEILTQPVGAPVIINHQEMLEGRPVEFVPGTYSLEVHPGVTSFTLRLAR